MSVHALETEDLENVPLVRMEEVLPSRECSYDTSGRDSDEESVEEVLGSCVIEDIVYDTEYIVNSDDDSNIGSMVSIKSEEVVEDEDVEMIVPEIIEDIPSKVSYIQSVPVASWPTLEILPGGVIRKPDKTKAVECTFDDDFNEEGEMMYACAKCSESFKYLYCLVKHVKMHEDEAKKAKKAKELGKTKDTCTSQSECKHIKKQNPSSRTKSSTKRKMVLAIKTSKKKQTAKSGTVAAQHNIVQNMGFNS